MALPLPPGLTPPEVAFLCEMELVTVIPRQRLDGLELLGGPTPPLTPPLRANLPLWLALLLKRQRRCNILAPPWLHPASLTSILETETEHSKAAFSPAPKLPPKSLSSSSQLTLSPPFLPSSTADSRADALPFHWMEMGELLLSGAADDIADADLVRRLLRDLREVRMAKVRAGVEVLDAGGGVQMNGVGGMEVAEGRAFIGGVVDGLRRIGASREQVKREREAEERERGLANTADDDYDAMDL
ncbi:GINS complex, PSF2 component [Aulographum hederae CBS 113979]|uniref:DNA replication complex GINS protein PSF2 n=1 Tax=Aulographum hederae CBS 113979 TaxID=1176131 RepID=A0A6G1GQM4_9PEZI|nr:GINS complex, PSF2 component [Aulographum hederae CBS 113979]